MSEPKSGNRVRVFNVEKSHNPHTRALAKATRELWEENDRLEARVQQLEEDNQRLEKALKFQKDQNKMLMEGRRGI